MVPPSPKPGTRKGPSLGEVGRVEPASGFLVAAAARHLTQHPAEMGAVFLGVLTAVAS